LLSAQTDDDAPPISITSPDHGTTFAFATIKTHSLVWDRSQRMMLALVTFTDAQMNEGQPNDDSHEFRLPGVTYDEAKGMLYATSSTGEVIPVAHLKRTLFIKSIETLPNARVRVVYPRGKITVILEAIRPDDPAMHPAPTDPDGTHDINLQSAVQ
jgi:hypothetical protein